MDFYRVTFKDGGNCEIEQVTVHVANVVFAVERARLKVIKDKGVKACSAIDRETVSVTIEKIIHEGD